MLAVCIDLSKAYDTIRLDFLEFLLAGSGMPPEVWRPIMDMAKAPRRLKVLSAVGEWRDPMCGLVPGCATATRIVSFFPRAVAEGPHLQLPWCHDPVLG